VRGGPGNDDVRFGNPNATVYLGPGQDRADSAGSGGGSTTVYGGSGPDVFYFDDFGTGYGGRGDDQLNGFLVSDFPGPNDLFGGPGDDHLVAAGGDTLRGGPDEDLLEVEFYGGADQLLGDDGDDTLDAVDGEADDTLDGGAEDTADVCNSDPGEAEVNCEA
jgi:hypothetical protein